MPLTEQNKAIDAMKRRDALALLCRLSSRQISGAECTIGALADDLGWTVRKTHQVAQESCRIDVCKDYRAGNGVGTYPHVAMYVLESWEDGET